jgi:aminopeptidase N
MLMRQRPTHKGSFMKGQETTIQKTYLKDYQQLSYKITNVDLDFSLSPQQTYVHAQILIETKGSTQDIFLNGEELDLKFIAIDGIELKNTDYEKTNKGLILKNISQSKFKLETKCLIQPEKNLALEGLYLSGDILCTQNEPEGFRRITYFIDRPDNMAIYTVKLTADKKAYPYLLSNGNCTGSGDLPDGKHWTTWHDPFPKPSYLFALVAGQLGLIKNKFKTKSGRNIELSIYCDPGQEQRCQFAMESLIKAMKWDEERFDLEYDLDQYMIVSVGSFNAGAMENKGLNIFNSALVLAEQATATDADYMAIESVIGHEYFHNWTGNRVTCRDWFQLTLKEGLTVFRDQEFSSDINSRAVQRIQDVKGLKEAQFPEDASPMAHPIRPESYAQINNFYTATVYEKGAEVIRMIHTLVGEDGFQKGMKKYFELFDGQAVTTEDFLHSMKLANSHFDLEQFKNWYSQIGTPTVEVWGEYNTNNKTYELSYKQTHKSNSETSGQKMKPLLIPLKVGFLNMKGEEFKPDLKTKSQAYWDQSVVALTEHEGQISFSNVLEEPVLSINRSLSAPVYLKSESSLEQDLHLFRYDKDQFNRYEVGQKIISDFIIENVASEDEHVLSPKIITAFADIINDKGIDDHMKALLLSAPTESVLHQKQKIIDFTKTKIIRDSYLDQIAQAFESQFVDIYESLKVKTKGGFSSEKVGSRALKNLSLGFLARLGTTYEKLVFDHYKDSDNMTDQFSGIYLINSFFETQAEKTNEEFYQKWRKEDLVLQKWINTQTLGSDQKLFIKVFQLKSLPEYNSSVPNYVRSLWGSFARNYSMFHHESGTGYKIIADQIIELDSINRSMAAALAKTYRIKTSVSEKNKTMINNELQRILDQPKISNNLAEVADQILNS